MYKCTQAFSWLHADGSHKRHVAGDSFEACAADVAKAKRMGFIVEAKAEAQSEAESEKPKGKAK
jgi:hypothetical protein